MIILSDEDHNKSTENLGVDSAHPAEADKAPEASQNNSESALLQEQDPLKLSDGQTNSDESPQHDDSKDTDTFHDNDKKSKEPGTENLVQLLENLADFGDGIESDLRWKEKLKLLALDAYIALPYYNLWRHEANMYFRRAAIIRNRRKKLENKGD